MMRKPLRIRSFVPFYVLVFTGCLMLTVFGSRVVTVMSESAPLEGRHRVIIDAGHGGVDGGATSCTGVLESAINLQIALRLDDLFHLLGYDTSMIRTTDESVYTQGETIAEKKISDLKQRVRMINGTDNALLVSIHQNHFSDSRYSGAQVFYAQTNGSETFAKKLQSALSRSLDPRNKRQAKRSSGIYLMEHIECTGILVECGFLSNPEEETKLRNAEYQKKLCCVIASTVSNHLDR